MPRYIFPATSFGYHRLFVQSGSETRLIDFLQTVLPTHHQLTSLSLPVERPPRTAPERLLPITASTQAGASLFIGLKWERVRWPSQASIFADRIQGEFVQRMQSAILAMQEIYLIAILDFEYDEHEERRNFLKKVQFKDQDGDLFYEKLNFKFVQMPLFDKELEALETHFDKWLYFLKNLAELDDIPAILREPIFEKAFHTAEVGKLTGDELLAYQMSQIEYWDMTAAIDSALENGREKGRRIGLELGKNLAQTEIVRRMSAKGIPPSDIAALLDLPIDQVHTILASGR